MPFLVIPTGYLLTSRASLAIVAVLAALGVAMQILGVTINYSWVISTIDAMHLSPESAYLLVPEISPIPTHLRYLLSNRFVDLWILWIYQAFGPVLFLCTLLVPLSMLTAGISLLLPERTARPVVAEAPGTA